MQIIKDVGQGSDEWHSLRLGLVTASRFKDVIANGVGGAASKTRKSYMLQLAGELLTGQKEDSFRNEYTDWGTATEPQARAMYEFETGNSVEEVAFIRHDTIEAGCSPDGLVGDNGLIEIKCPKTSTQIVSFLGGKMPTTHKPQVQGQLWISDREWCDFVSFDPRINGASGYFCVRVERDESFIGELESKIISFEAELSDLVEKLK